MSEQQRQQQRLLELLRERSFRRGKITLSSGKESDYYLDCKHVTLSAEGLELTGELIWERIAALEEEGGEKVGVKGVGGLTLGADPMVCAVALAGRRHGKDLQAFIVRKEPKGHGTEEYLEGRGNLEDGARVVIVEDVLTTGASTLKAVERSRKAGLEVVRVMVLVDRCEEQGRENIEERGIPVEALFTRGDFIE